MSDTAVCRAGNSDDTNTVNADEILKLILNNTLKEIMGVIKADYGSIFLFDSHNKELVLDSFYNSDDICPGCLRQKIGEGISGKVAEKREPVLVKDIRRDARFRRNGFKHYRTNSFISIPLFSSKRLLGVLNLGDKSSGDSFSQSDFEFAITISRYACLIMESFDDCRELKQERATFDRQRQFLEKYATLGKLAAGIVHEINNPLDGVIRYTNLLLCVVENNNVANEFLLEVKKGLNRIADITKSLLQFSYQANSASAQAKKYADIHLLLTESVDALSSRIKTNIEIEKKYNDTLPKVLDLGLTPVFINLVKNALDAMPAGGRLEISTDIRDSGLEVSFRDTGGGMSFEVRKHIFEPFFTTKAMNSGTGLGLSISKEIMNMYGGRIEVESSPGSGSTFTVIIPGKYLENG